ncbi:hypothetical protein TNCV_1849501 [Trichonephila clavipes]|nr:hypothetical protein TNCV_1849501 [Trichonephila clavipes]
MTDSIPDKTTVLCRQSDENSAANDTNLLTDVKPTVSRHGRLVKETCLGTPSSSSTIFFPTSTFNKPHLSPTPQRKPGCFTSSRTLTLPGTINIDNMGWRLASRALCPTTDSDGSQSERFCDSTELDRSGENEKG